jgi:hypothetical protein
MAATTIGLLLPRVLASTEQAPAFALGSIATIIQDMLNPPSDVMIVRLFL